MRDGRLTSKKALWFYAPAVGVLIIDQVTKAIARAMLGSGQSVTVIPGFFDLTLTFNSGAAFGVLPNWTPLFIIIALAAIFAIVRLRKADSDSKVLSAGLGVLLGGAIGNLIDRLFLSNHAVTDFIDLHITISGEKHSWPTFNIADIAILVGAVMVIYYVYVIDRNRAESGQT